MTPSVVLGVPTYNGGATVREALASLLEQDGPELAVLVVDDASTDDTRAIVEDIAAADARVHVLGNSQRLGMVDNWNKVLHESLTRFPAAEFFAWGSDHDVWRPGWLHKLATALESAPSAVLAYPLVERLSGGRPVPGGHWTFDTTGHTSPVQRLGHTVRDGVAGDMIYGLFRARALAEVGGYQPVVYPDRLLLGRVALRGQFLQVPEVLWSRRMGALSTAERQRRTLFAGRPPAHARLPWWVQHPLLLSEPPVARLMYARAAGGVALRGPRAKTARFLRSVGLLGPARA